ACVRCTPCGDPEPLLAGVRAGARGYLRKDVTIQTLARAIRVLAEGGTFFQPSLTEKLLRGVSRVARLAAPEPVFLDPLTARETEVMRLGAGGYSNREIGEALSAAEATVKVHVSSILSKLGVRDRVQAVLRALESGVIKDYSASCRVEAVSRAEGNLSKSTFSAMAVPKAKGE